MSSKNNTKKQQAQTTKNTASLAKATGIDLTKSLAALSNSGVQIQGTLSKISEELITKHAELQAVDDSIALKKQEMTALHGADQVLLTIDELRAQHVQTIEQLAKERASIETEHSQLIAQQQVERQREEDGYGYRLQQQRKTETDAWTEQVRVRGNQERDRQEKFEKDIVNREEALRLKEVEYQAALAKAASFEADVQKEVSKQTAIVTSTLTRDFNHKNEITTIQNKAEVEKLRFDNQRLVEAANNLELSIKELQVQLKASHEAQTQLAKDAVSAASNKQAQADAMALVTNIGGGNGANRART